MQYRTATLTVLFIVAITSVSAGQSSVSSKPGPGFQALVQDAKTRVKEMNVDQLKALIASGESFTLIDVREDSEWAAGHAVSAVHMGRGVIERDIESAIPQKQAKLVLYCGSGARSALAADSLARMGYSHVFSLSGGMNAYRSAGLPTQ